MFILDGYYCDIEYFTDILFVDFKPNLMFDYAPCTY